jgi:hypothetical protein
VERITLDGSHHRTDIAAKVATAAENTAAHPTA